MSKRIISALLSILMVLSIIPVFEIDIKAEDKGDYIIYIDVEKHSPEFKKYYGQRNFEEAMKLSNEALDFYEKQLLDEIPDLEVVSRIELLLPSIVVKVSEEHLEAIKAFDFVKDVFANGVIEAPNFTSREVRVSKDRNQMGVSPMMVNSNELIGSDDLLLGKYNGAGSVLAILDHDMDPTHDAFYLTDNINVKLQKYDVENALKNLSWVARNENINEVYRSPKIPFGVNYDKFAYDRINLNPFNKEAGHGQHIAGTVAGNKLSVAGKTWRGVAPEAQLLLMNIFRSNDLTYVEDYVLAMQDAIVLGADAVNMSLGGTKGRPEDIYNSVLKAINNGYEADTNFVIAAGNEGEYEGDLHIENPDFGTIGSPGIAENAITVASLENKSLFSKAIGYEGEKYPFKESGKKFFEEGSYEFVDCGLGRVEDIDRSKVSGKIALIQRGGDPITGEIITYATKINNAEAAGAMGVIMYNSVSGLITMTGIDETKIPSIFIDKDAGLKLLEGDTNTVRIYNTVQEVKNPKYGELSAFTNWGLSIGGFMKPDITAPGGEIYSTNNDNGFAMMSGTSMATPHVTGGVGVIRSRLNEPMFEKAKMSKAALTKTILMNSAVPHTDPKTNAKTSPRRQGAGVMDLTKAVQLDFTVVDRDTKIASKFVGDVDNEIKLDLIIHNYSNEQKTLIPSVDATIDARKGKKLLLRPEALFSKTYEDKKVIVEPGEQKEYSITIPIENLEKIKDYTNGAFVEGFLYLTDQNDMEISFPFVSFKGNYESIPSIEKPLYEFKFEEEKPMFWNLYTENHPWHNFSTHIETNYGTVEDKFGYKIPKRIIAGLKNFDEIDETKNTKEEPEPIFEDIIISPNEDGYFDDLDLYLVMTRTADVKAYIVNKENGTELHKYNLGRKFANNSFYADDRDNREDFLGFYKENVSDDLDELEDGKYTLKLESKALYGEKVGSATYRYIDFTVDKTAPETKNVSYDEDSRILSFEIEDALSEVAHFEVKAGEDVIEYKKDGKKINVTIPEGKELKDITIYTKDTVYNEKNINAEVAVNPDVYGSLEVNIKLDTFGSINVKYKVVNLDTGEEIKDIKDDKIENIRFGKYKLIVTDYPFEYKLKNGKHEIEFEISEKNKNHRIDLNFGWVGTSNVTIIVEDKADLEYQDFKIFAKNINNGKVFEFKEKNDYNGIHFDAVLQRETKYIFYAEFAEGKDGYAMSFSEYKYGELTPIPDGEPHEVYGMYPELKANIKKVPIKEKVTVSFDTDGGNEIKPVKVEKGKTVEKPEEPTKDGYKFVKWTLDGEEYDFSKAVEKDIILKAEWEKLPPVMVTVTFDTDGGNEIKPVKVEKGKTVEKPEEPTKDGYKFVKWTLDGEEYDFSKAVEKDIILKAEWEKLPPVMVTVTFDTDGGNEIKPVKVEKGKTVEKPEEPTKDGYKFVKWTLDGEKYNFENPVEKDIILKAEWEKLPPVMVTVTFDTDGGNEIKPVKVEKGKTVEKPEEPTKDGYKFVKWTLDGEEYDFSKAVEKDITLKAEWEKLPPVMVTVTFDTDGGNEIKPVKVEKGKTVEKPEEPTKDGYKFVKWTLDGEEYDFSKAVEKDITLKAEWEKLPPVMVTVTFDTDGGNEIKPVKVEKGKTVEKPEEPTKDGYKFVKWTLDGEEYNFENPVEKDITLKAEWEEVKPEPQPEPKPEDPGHFYEPSPDRLKKQPKREPKKEEPKKEVKEEPKKEIKEEVKEETSVVDKIEVAAPHLPVTLVDIPQDEIGTAISNMVARGILKGTGNNKFEPEVTITRAMVTEVFMRISKDKTFNPNVKFKDLEEGKWYTNSVKWAATKNIITGFEDGTFRPNQKVTKQEFAVMLDRMLREYGIEMPAEVAIDEAVLAQLPEWSKASIIRMLKAGILKLEDVEKLTEEYSRAELAVAINKVIEFLGK